MSGRNTGAKKEDEKSGLGFLGALAVAGGAAAIGYMASDLWKSFQHSSHGHRTAQECRPPPQEQRRPSQSYQSTQRSRLNQEQAQTDSTRPSRNNDADALTCIICCDNQRDCMLDPCGHIVLCKACGDKIDACPICMKPIRQRMLVNIP